MKPALKMRSLAFLMFVCLSLTACGEAKLDMSSDKAYGESIKKIYEPLSEDDREEFRRNLGSVMSEIDGLGGSGYINEKDMYMMYNIATLFGGDEGVKALQALNGLTYSEITKRGRDIRRAKLATRLEALKAEAAELEKAVADDEKFVAELKKVEAACTGIEAIEALGFRDKPEGVVGVLAASITVKNNSSMVLENVDGRITFSDEVGKIDDWGLQDNLRPANLGMKERFDPKFNIAPGAEWQGKFFLKLGIGHANNKKRHPFPVPPDKQYTASISDLTPNFVTEKSYRQSGMESRVTQLQNRRNSIKQLEEELAALK